MITSVHPVFVLGAPYSGTNALAWSLARHPNMTLLGETDWLVNLAEDLDYLHELSTAKPSAHLHAIGTMRSHFYEAFGNAVDQLVISHRQCLEPSTRWIDCTAAHAFAVAGLLRLFPYAKFIHVVRDVSSVVKALVTWCGPESSA